MRNPEGTTGISLLLTGFLVLFIPLCFFYSLLETALERSRESAAGLLREKIMLAAEQIRLVMKPANYVKEIIREAHKYTLPDISPKLIRMRPTADFGKDIFDERLPGRLLQEIRRHGIDALMVHVNGPEFASGHSWFCEDLVNQCNELEQLALEHTQINYSTAVHLYQQHYQKKWAKHGQFSPYLTKAFMGWQERKFSFAWLSRYAEIVGGHDRIEEVFTDYFGQQSIYYYSYLCMSAVNIHGAYALIVPQKSIDPAAILKRAASIKTEGLSVSIQKNLTHKTGFVESARGFAFLVKPPTEFWSHYLFAKNSADSKNGRRRSNLTIKISGSFNAEFENQKWQFSIFRLVASLALIFYASWAFRCWLFGFSLQISTRRKLAVILGIIVIIPVLGVGILTFLSLRSSARVIENQLIQQANNSIRELSLLNDENNARQMAAGLEIKRRLESNNSNERRIPEILLRPAELSSWITTWSNSVVFARDDGFVIQYNGFLREMPNNRLVNSLLEKYMDSLGIEKTSRPNKLGNFSRTMTLGIMENYITPEFEEAWIVHENTVQRELSHTADTSKAILMVIRDLKNRFYLVYQRLSNYNESIYRYLSYQANNNPLWFTNKGRYGDVYLGVRLRKILEMFMFGWPTAALLSPEMNANFARALSTKESGQSISRNGDDLEINAWRYKEGDSAIISAIAKTRGGSFGFAGLATRMIFPFFAGYALLLLYFITSIIVEFINGPVKIINHGVEALNREEYGVMIASFSEDEFEKVTRAFNEMSNALKQREMIKRYVSGVLIQQVQSGNASMTGESTQIKVAILASDLRGFTSISEKYSPAEVVEMLNSYFTRMEEAIKQFGGSIDKYVGDAVQAVFFEESGQENPSLRACKAALRMRQQLKALNSERAAQGLFVIDNGIGIDTGMVVSGSIGSETGRKDFTVTGKIIERAAYLESLTRNTESRILVSCEAHQEAGVSLKTREFSPEAMELQNV